MICFMTTDDASYIMLLAAVEELSTTMTTPALTTSYLTSRHYVQTSTVKPTTTATSVRLSTTANTPEGAVKGSSPKRTTVSTARQVVTSDERHTVSSQVTTTLTAERVMTSNVTSGEQTTTSKAAPSRDAYRTPSSWQLATVSTDTKPVTSDASSNGSLVPASDIGKLARGGDAKQLLTSEENLRGELLDNCFSKFSRVGR